MTEVRKIALFTDFGTGPYVGQMMLRLADLAPGVGVVDLVSDLAPFRPDLAAYLLPALSADLSDDTLFLCVVDPGVGGDRAALAMRADRRWYVGPDNGLLAMSARRASQVQILRVTWRPRQLSNSFHGRDLFCPVAAMLASGEWPEAELIAPESIVGADWPEDLAQVIYTDRYGNLITGMRAAILDRGAPLRTTGHEVAYARTFCEVGSGEAFWYENSFGLAELAVNQGRADLALGLGPGGPIDASAALLRQSAAKRRV